MARNNCKGKCLIDKKFKKLSPIHAYKNGFKFCAVCEKSRKTDDIRCQCCTTKFRTAPRNKKYTELRTVP